MYRRIQVATFPGVQYGLGRGPNLQVTRRWVRCKVLSFNLSRPSCPVTLELETGEIVAVPESDLDEPINRSYT